MEIRRARAQIRRLPPSPAASLTGRASAGRYPTPDRPRDYLCTSTVSTVLGPVDQVVHPDPRQHLYANQIPDLDGLQRDVVDLHRCDVLREVCCAAQHPDRVSDPQATIGHFNDGHLNIREVVGDPSDQSLVHVAPQVRSVSLCSSGQGAAATNWSEFQRSASSDSGAGVTVLGVRFERGC